MNVYESIPTMEKGEIRLRPVTAEDEAALLRVYGDPLALPFSAGAAVLQQRQPPR